MSCVNETAFKSFKHETPRHSYKMYRMGNSCSIAIGVGLVTVQLALGTVLMMGNLCDNCAGIPSEWSYVTPSHSHHDPCSHPYLVSIIFMHVGHIVFPF